MEELVKLLQHQNELADLQHAAAKAAQTVVTVFKALKEGLITVDHIVLTNAGGWTLRDPQADAKSA